MPLYINLLLHSSSFIFCLGTHSCLCSHIHSFFHHTSVMEALFLLLKQWLLSFLFPVPGISGSLWLVFSRYSCPSAQSALQRSFPCQPKEEWAKYSLQTKYGPPPVFVDKVLLEYNYAYSFTYCLSYNLEILTYKTYNT